MGGACFFATPRLQDARRIQESNFTIGQPKRSIKQNETKNIIIDTDDICVHLNDKKYLIRMVQHELNR